MGLRLPLLLWRRHHTLRKTRKIASRMAAQNASLFMVAFIGVQNSMPKICPSRLEFLQSAIKMNDLFPTCELLFSSEDYMREVLEASQRLYGTSTCAITRS